MYIIVYSLTLNNNILHIQLCQYFTSRFALVINISLLYAFGISLILQKTEKYMIEIRFLCKPDFNLLLFSLFYGNLISV